MEYPSTVYLLGPLHHQLPLPHQKKAGKRPSYARLGAKRWKSTRRIPPPPGAPPGFSVTPVAMPISIDAVATGSALPHVFDSFSSLLSCSFKKRLLNSDIQETSRTFPVRPSESNEIPPELSATLHLPYARFQFLVQSSVIGTLGILLPSHFCQYSRYKVIAHYCLHLHFSNYKIEHLFMFFGLVILSLGFLFIAFSLLRLLFESGSLNKMVI